MSAAIPLSPSQRSKIRRLSAHVDPAPGEEAGELNIIPYLDIITNVLVFVLATISVVFLSNFDSEAPSQNSGKTQAATNKALNLTVLIVKDGISMKTSNGNIAAGCDAPPHQGSGIAVPITTEGTYNWGAVKKCARDLKELNPDFEEEVAVTILASPGVEFKHVVAAVDALRDDDKGDLFPEVHFGVPR